MDFFEIYINYRWTLEIMCSEFWWGSIERYLSNRSLKFEWNLRFGKNHNGSVKVGGGRMSHFSWSASSIYGCIWSTRILNFEKFIESFRSYTQFKVYGVRKEKEGIVHNNGSVEETSLKVEGLNFQDRLTSEKSWRIEFDEAGIYNLKICG